MIPNGDILPSRAKYNPATNDWQVAVNNLYAKNDNPDDALWFSLPDIVASKLLTGRIAKVVDAFRIEPQGTLRGLKPVKLRGVIEVNPRKQDFFRVVIEQRKLLASRSDFSETERKRLDKALKVLANAASYGIYAEMNRQESDDKVNVTCHGIDPKPFVCRVAHPDVPGEYSKRLSMRRAAPVIRDAKGGKQYTVTDLGGTYAMEDTDSMAIVASEQGGIVPTGNGSKAVRALSWEQVRQISERFAALNPYNREAIPGSVLKLEDDNFDPKTGKQRQLYCVAISAKRYALFLRDGHGESTLLRNGTNNKEDRWSEHGLGHLLNPTDPESEDREWIAQAWLAIVRKVLGLPTQDLGFENYPAVGRVTISSPAVMHPLENLNKRKRYPDQLKPFNFLLTCHVKAFGHPPGTDPEQFHLIAPYESDPKRWLKMEWTDQYTGKRYRITTEGYHGDRYTARVKTYGDVLGEYEFHAESKCADTSGKTSGKQTIGLLQRRHIEIDQIKYIGKESNMLEEVEAGLIHSAQNAYTEYTDPKRDEWTTKILPALKSARRDVLLKMTPLSRTEITDIRAGRVKPHPTNQKLLVNSLRKLGLL